MSPPDRARGAFVVFEGGDGSGKSTQARILAESLGAKLTREPGGTPVGEAIRAVVLDPSTPELSAKTEALLMAASRAQHVEELIEPLLASGTHVVSDRFVASSLAYQGVGRQLGVEDVQEINSFGLSGLKPDLTILLDVGATNARERLGDDLDRIEQAGAGLGEQVNEAYRSFAKADPDRWFVVDAQNSIDQLASVIRSEVEGRLGL